MTNRLMYKQIVGDSGFKTADAFNESDHPRADNGQFGSGGGNAAPKSGGKAESKGKADKPASKESGKGAKPGWMLKADPKLAAKVKANQARHQEMKKHLGSGPSKQGESKPAEGMKSNNEGFGYHGELAMKEGSEKAHETFKKKAAEVKAITGESDAKTVRDYLDSTRGRHLADMGEKADAEYIKKDFAKFKKTYDPEDYK